MSTKVFNDNIFPRHVSDLMTVMHMVVFNGTDGDEKWATFLQLKQKEYVALGLAQYYQCEHCIEYHMAAVARLEKNCGHTFSQNVNSMILFLRIDSRTIGSSEKEHWIQAWQRFAQRVSTESDDPAIPYLIGLAIGIARDDDFLIQFCGAEVNRIFISLGIDSRAVLGELEAVVIFMKAAVSKNLVVDKIERLLQSSQTLANQVAL